MFRMIPKQFSKTLFRARKAVAPRANTRLGLERLGDRIMPAVTDLPLVSESFAAQDEAEAGFADQTEAEEGSSELIITVIDPIDIPAESQPEAEYVPAEVFTANEVSSLFEVYPDESAAGYTELVDTGVATGDWSLTEINYEAVEKYAESSRSGAAGMVLNKNPLDAATGALSNGFGSSGRGAGVGLDQRTQDILFGNGPLDPTKVGQLGGLSNRGPMGEDGMNPFAGMERYLPGGKSSVPGQGGSPMIPGGGLGSLNRGGMDGGTSDIGSFSLGDYMPETGRDKELGRILAPGMPGYGAGLGWGDVLQLGGRVVEGYGIAVGGLGTVVAGAGIATDGALLVSGGVMIAGGAFSYEMGGYMKEKGAEIKAEDKAAADKAAADKAAADKAAADKAAADKAAAEKKEAERKEKERKEKEAPKPGKKPGGKSGMPADDGTGPAGPYSTVGNAFMPADDGTGPSGPRSRAGNAFMPADDGTGPSGPYSGVATLATKDDVFSRFMPNPDDGGGVGPQSNVASVVSVYTVSNVSVAAAGKSKFSLLAY